MRSIFDGRDVVVAGQVSLDGETEVGGESVHGVIGMPIVLGPEGWTRVMLDPLEPDETRRLQRSIARVSEILAGWEP